MNEILWLLYLGDIVSGVTGFALVCLTLSGFAVYTFCAIGHINSIWDKMRKPIIYSGLICVLSAVVFVGVPSKKFLYILAGAKGAELALETSIGLKTVKLIEQKLDEVLSEKDK